MRFEIVLAPAAANAMAEVIEGLEKFLRHEPARTSKARIKRLRGLSQPQYRLRVGEIRVFYDVREGTVEILAIMSKAEVADWLGEYGVAEENEP
jgi:mRNA-degrading endonuclease RelE of RelBE toxin-antitoxin system